MYVDFEGYVQRRKMETVKIGIRVNVPMTDGNLKIEKVLGGLYGILAFACFQTELTEQTVWHIQRSSFAFLYANQTNTNARAEEVGTKQLK